MVQLNREPAEHVSGSYDELEQELKDIAERSSYTVPTWQPWREVTAPAGWDLTGRRPVHSLSEI